MKQHGQTTEEPISYRSSKLSRNEEGTSATLPFIESVEAVSRFIPLGQPIKDAIHKVSQIYPFRITQFYVSLIDKANPSCGIGRQSIPSFEEFDETGENDPLNEGAHMITPALIQKYPGRAVFMVNAECAMYCRFCNRRRMVGRGWNPGQFREETLTYLENDTTIGEVIISGGDPFMLPPEELAYILSRLRGMGKKILRISSRMPVVYPEGLTEDHYKAIDDNSPLWIVFHINHPKEISPEFIEVVKRLRQAGAMLVSQTVLLRNVNDCPHILSLLFEGLVVQGVKPYYLFQLDEAKGVSHFKVRLKTGIEIMRSLRKTISGLAMPQYALDIPGGSGKVPVDYQYIQGKEHDRILIESPLAGFGTYMDNGMESRCMKCGVCKSHNPINT
ncbi:MAG: hypothetical protein C0392_10540 [Syntrophus sp. (in: bacteria)]|nr:hypothetical protein [Syntrophus sp. (in: bacteria)]